jgi:serine/threonine protein kinase
MLAGHTPFKSTEAIEFAEMHRVERPRPLTLIRAGIREAICSIVMKALEKEPALRYQNASEMLVDVGGGDERPAFGSWSQKLRTVWNLPR